MEREGYITLEFNDKNINTDLLKEMRNFLLSIPCICFKNVKFFKFDTKLFPETISSILKSLPLIQDNIYNDEFINNIDKINVTFSAYNNYDEPILIKSEKNLIGVETVGNFPILWLDSKQEIKCVLKFQVSNAIENANYSAVSLITYYQQNKKWYLKFYNMGLHKNEKILEFFDSKFKNINYKII